MLHSASVSKHEHYRKSLRYDPPPLSTILMFKKRPSEFRLLSHSKTVWAQTAVLWRWNKSIIKLDHGFLWLTLSFRKSRIEYFIHNRFHSFLVYATTHPRHNVMQWWLTRVTWAISRYTYFVYIYIYICHPCVNISWTINFIANNVSMAWISDKL